LSLLGDRMVAIHEALDRRRLGHAFGGAIALAYCTFEPRGTRDIDVNVFVPPDDADRVFDALPDGVAVRPADRDLARRDGQVRVWWEETPVDVFLDVHDFHRQVATEIREVPFEGSTIPVLGCHALAVFKAFFNRTKYWADLEAMVEAKAVDVDRVLGVLVRLLGADDAATVRFQSLL
jgi:hypothetical protein